MAHTNTTSIPVIPEHLKSFAGPDLVDACIKDFDRFSQYYPKNYVTLLRNSLESELKAGGDAGALKFYDDVATIGNRRSKLEIQRDNTNKKRERIREWRSDGVEKFKPTAMAREAFRIMPHEGTGALFDDEGFLRERQKYIATISSDITPEELAAIRKNDLQSDVMLIRTSNLDTPLRFAPDIGHTSRVNEATKQVKQLIAANERAMTDVLNGKYQGNTKDVIRNFEKEEAKINEGDGSLKRLVKTVSKATSVPLKGLLKGTVYDSDPYEDSRLVDFRKKDRELAEGALAFYLADKTRLSDHVAEDEIIRRIAATGATKPLTQAEFEKIFSDIINKIKQAEASQTREAQGKIARFEDGILNLNKSLLSSVKDAVTEEDNMVKFRILQAALLLSPFVGLSILPHVLDFLSPFMNTDMAHAFGELIESEHTGIFGEIGQKLHLGDAVTWVLENFPIVSQFLDLIDAVMQSGIVQNAAEMLGPVIYSPLPEIMLGVAYSIVRTGTEINHYEGIQKKVEDARKAIKTSYADIAGDLDAIEQRSASLVADAKILALEDAYKKSMTGRFLRDIANGLTDSPDPTTPYVMSSECAPNQRIKDVMGLVKSVYDDENDVARILDAVGIEVELVPNATDPSKKPNIVFKSLTEKTADDIIRSGAVKAEDVKALSSLMYYIDRKIVEKDLDSSLGALPDSATDEAKKERRLLVFKNHKSLHEIGSETLMKKREEFFRSGNIDLNIVLQGFNAASKSHLEAEGQSTLSCLFMRDIAELKWGVDLKEYDGMTKDEVTENLKIIVERNEREFFNGCASNTHNILRPSANVSKPVGSPAVRTGPTPPIAVHP